MFALKADNFVCYLKNTLLPHDINQWESLGGGEYRKPGLMVTLDITLADYSPCNEGKEPIQRRADAHFVMCGNTNTFALLTGRAQRFEIDWSKFENISNHDTCWRSAIGDFLNGVYFKWAEEINAELPKKKRKAPKDLSQHCFAGFTGHRMLMVTYATDAERNRPGDSYFKKLLNVEYVK